MIVRQPQIEAQARSKRRMVLTRDDDEALPPQRTLALLCRGRPEYADGEVDPPVAQGDAGLVPPQRAKRHARLRGLMRQFR